LLQLLELLAGEGVGLFGAGLGLLGPLSLCFGGLDLFGADGVLGRIGGVRVLEGAAHGAGGPVLEVGGELGGDPGEASAAQRGLWLAVCAGAARRAPGAAARPVHALCWGGGRAPRPRSPWGGAVRGPGAAATGAGGARAPPRCEARGARCAALAELRGRG